MKKITFWILFLLFCFCGIKCKNNDRILIEYISYEYGTPLQKSPEGFDVRFVVKIDHQGRAEIIGRTKDKYKTITGQINSRLLKDIKSLDAKDPDITNHILEEKKMRILFSTDAYSYVKFKNQEICFMPNYMSFKFKKMIRNLREELGKTFERKDHLEDININISKYKKEIVPIHNVSGLPILKIPPSKVPEERK